MKQLLKVAIWCAVVGGLFCNPVRASESEAGPFFFLAHLPSLHLKKGQKVLPKVYRFFYNIAATHPAVILAYTQNGNSLSQRGTKSSWADFVLPIILSNQTAQDGFAAYLDNEKNLKFFTEFFRVKNKPKRDFFIESIKNARDWQEIDMLLYSPQLLKATDPVLLRSLLEWMKRIDQNLWACYAPGHQPLDLVSDLSKEPINRYKTGKKIHTTLY